MTHTEVGLSGGVLRLISEAMTEGSVRIIILAAGDAEKDYQVEANGTGRQT